MLDSDSIRRLALKVGFDDVGCAAARRLDNDARFMDEWVDAGLAGEMSYLERNRDLRYDIRLLVPEAKTVVVCLLSYAKSGRDYHRAVKSKLYELKQRMADAYGSDIFHPEKQHIFCDSAPVLERRWAVEAGLGFIGRNHQFIHPILGSLVHPGELVLQVSVAGARSAEPVSSPADITSPAYPGCGDCHRCIESCPRQALGQSEWDARRCIAYETHKCIICQQNCPYNEKLF